MIASLLHHLPTRSIAHAASLWAQIKSWIVGRGRHMNARAEIRALRRSLHIDMAPRTYQRLVALRALTEAATFGEVIRHALRAYEAQLRADPDANTEGHNPA